MYQKDDPDGLDDVEQFYPEFELVRKESAEETVHSDHKYINFAEIQGSRQSKVENLALLNLASYMFELSVLATLILADLEGNIFQLEKLETALLLNARLKNTMWVSVFLLKGVFVFLPLINAQESFNEIVIIRIKYSFCFL